VVCQRYVDIGEKRVSERNLLRADVSSTNEWNDHRNAAPPPPPRAAELLLRTQRRNAAH